MFVIFRSFILVIGVLFIIKKADASCTDLDSYFGPGFCFKGITIFTLEMIGPRQCLNACYKNRQCQGVNYYKSTLRCDLQDRDSPDDFDFVSDSECIYFSISSNIQVSVPGCLFFQAPGPVLIKIPKLHNVVH